MAPPNMIFLITKGMDYLGFILPLGSEISPLSSFKTRSFSFWFLDLSFLMNALVIFF